MYRESNRMAPETAAGLAHCQRAAGAPESDALVPHAPQGQHCLSGVGNVPRVANKDPAAAGFGHLVAHTTNLT